VSGRAILQEAAPTSKLCIGNAKLQRGENRRNWLNSGNSRTNRVQFVSDNWDNLSWVRPAIDTRQPAVTLSAPAEHHELLRKGLHQHRTNTVLSM
jgi:hypothetical protein